MEYGTIVMGICKTLFCGKSILPFRLIGLPQVVQDSSTLYAFNELIVMSAAIDSLVKSQSLARELGERGRNHAIERFSAARIIPQYEALYRRIIVPRPR